MHRFLSWFYTTAEVFDAFAAAGAACSIHLENYDNPCLPQMVSSNEQAQMSESVMVNL